MQKVTGFTTDFKGLEAKVDKVEQPFGQTSLYDAIAETAKAVGAAAAERRGGVPQRAAIVVLTDGIDTKSRLTAPEVSAIASSIDVPVYIVAVMSPVDDPRNPDYGTGALEQRLDGPGAVDGRRVLHRDRTGAREHGGAADCR